MQVLIRFKNTKDRTQLYKIITLNFKFSEDNIPKIKKCVFRTITNYKPDKLYDKIEVSVFVRGKEMHKYEMNVNRHEQKY